MARPRVEVLRLVKEGKPDKRSHDTKERGAAQNETNRGEMKASVSRNAEKGP
jgi:hypothetical protein